MRSLLLYSCLLATNVFAQSTQYQLLWEIKGPKLKKTSYLFGSIHSNDARVFRFPDSLYTVFNQVDALVLETDITSLFDQFDVRINPFPLDVARGRQAYADPHSATETIYGSEDGRPQFLDAYFQQTAYIAGKQFFALEEVEDQLKATEELEKITRKKTLSRQYSEETFLLKYLAGDIVGLTNMLQSQLAGLPGAYESLISKRNTIMTVGIDSLIKKRSIFCTVGSGHLYGPDGIIQQLRQKGYQLRPIQATYSKDMQADQKKMKSWNTYPISNANFRFQLNLPGKPLIIDSVESYRCIYQEMGQGNSYELIVYKTQGSLEDCKSEFIDVQRQRPINKKLPNGLDAVEGLYKDAWKGLQWKRVIIKGDFTYIMVCYGGNKFMHSNRPQLYFDKLIIL